MRSEMRHLFVRVAYDTNAPPYHGIPELLEFYGCIVNGFVAPLKDEHKVNAGVKSVAGSRHVKFCEIHLPGVR